MSDDDELEPIIRRPPSDATAWGRINGRDRRLYARLWGCDLDSEDGREDFDITFKMMFVDHAEAEGVPGELGYHTIDEETFARNWRPPPMSELIETLLANERARRAEPPRPN
jgi:hypothetical protein